MAHMHDAPRRIIAAAVTLLLVCVVHYTQEAHAATTSDFTAEQRTHTARFLKEFLSGATELQSAWTGTNFCEWRGVACSDAATVNVDLSKETLGSGVTLAELSDEVDGSQVMVRELCVAYNASSLEGTLPESWSRLINMQLIDLHGSALSGTLPAVWSSMAALHTVYLDGNHLTGPLPNEWASMNSLTNLMMMENSLSGALPDAWGALPLGSYVYLSDNTFCGCVPSSWSSLHVVVDESVTDATCAEANACPTITPTTTARAPSSSFVSQSLSFGNLSSFWVVLIFVIGCVRIAGV